MDVKERKSFADVDIGKKAYLTYYPFDEVPNNRIFNYGEVREIVLQNENGKLEKIKYKLSGAFRPDKHSGYSWIFGQVESIDYQGCLVFNYHDDGSISKITLSFCGASPSTIEFKAMTKSIKYPAEMTAIDPFSRFKRYQYA